MIKEIDLGGIYIAPAFGIALLALGVTWLLTAVLHRLGFYALVWHRYLFDAAMFVLIFGAATFLLFDTT